VKIPTILYTFEVDNFAEGDEADGSILSKGEPIPGIGAKCLLVPSLAGNQMFTIKRIWTVESCHEIDEDGWTHELMLTSDPVPNPIPWYDITEHLLIEGLAPVVGAPAWDNTSSGFYSGGTRVVHKPTIEAIFRILGLN
jgi:hypothetical protein